jgi:phosphoribosylglycinamide formyltransferase-1
MVKVAIFASGKGSNANNICEFFKNSQVASIDLIVSDNPKAGAQLIADKFNISLLELDSTLTSNSALLLSNLQLHKIDFIVLAGYLKLIPKLLIESFPKRIINIHPALLPYFGGKGMYGMNVHNAVSSSGATETGITVHFVDENYDEGAIIFQSKIAIMPNEDASIIAQKINQLELECYPEILLNTIERYISKNHNSD